MRARVWRELGWFAAWAALGGAANVAWRRWQQATSDRQAVRVRRAMDEHAEGASDDAPG